MYALLTAYYPLTDKVADYICTARGGLPQSPRDRPLPNPAPSASPTSPSMRGSRPLPRPPGASPAPPPGPSMPEARPYSPGGARPKYPSGDSYVPRSGPVATHCSRVGQHSESAIWGYGSGPEKSDIICWAVCAGVVGGDEEPISPGERASRGAKKPGA